MPQQRLDRETPVPAAILRLDGLAGNACRLVQLEFIIAIVKAIRAIEAVATRPSRPEIAGFDQASDGDVVALQPAVVVEQPLGRLVGAGRAGIDRRSTTASDARTESQPHELQPEPQPRRMRRNRRGAIGPAAAAAGAAGGRRRGSRRSRRGRLVGRRRRAIAAA